jgi:hypothetical protein
MILISDNRPFCKVDTNSTQRKKMDWIPTLFYYELIKDQKFGELQTLDLRPRRQWINSSVQSLYTRQFPFLIKLTVKPGLN